jgi:branched-chain amino acid transport system substrate-binding protein
MQLDSGYRLACVAGGMLMKRVIIAIACAAVLILIYLGYANRHPGGVLRIGCITPLTGDGATYGAATQRGAGLAIDEVNSAGGIDGKRLELICEDDQMSPRIGADAIQKLISADKVPVILGAFGSSVTLAIAPIAERAKVVLFSASSTADAIKDAGDYIFRNVPPNKGQGDTAAAFVRTQLKATKATILEMNNDYGVSLGTAFKSAFEKAGGTVLSVESYNPGTTDFRAQLTKIRAQTPEVVFFPGHYQESGLILKQARELGITSTFVGGDGSYSPELIKIAGPAAEGSYYTLMAMAFGTADQKIEKFVSAYKTKYGSDPDVYSAYAYDGVLNIAEAIRTGGYTADGIKNALYQITFDGVTGVTKFDKFGEVDKPYGIYEVKNGDFVLERWR